jgi:glycogen debranching enzyme
MPETVGTTSPFYIPATGSSGTERPHVLKHGDCFAVLDACGQVQAFGPAAEGLFFEDTRYLSRLAIAIDGQRPLLLSSAVSEDNVELAVDLTNPDLIENDTLRSARDVVHILGSTILADDALMLALELHNFATTAAVLQLALEFDSDFRDLFELRGSVRNKRGERLPDMDRSGVPVLGYRGLDGIIRRAVFAFDPAPRRLAARQALWDVALPPGARRTFTLAVRCEHGTRSSRASRDVRLAEIERERRARTARAVRLYSSNENFNDWLHRSRVDLDMLVTETADGPYAYAGIPWFSTAFGRDGLITALQCLWLDPALAAGTLRFLAARQARTLDPKADAEPGKILHETRKGEMALVGEVPFRLYYGSVDATPLFVVLAAAYHARTGDTDLIRAIWPAIERALQWMRDYADPDGDGFLEYDRKSPNGLVNQGWKDSGDAIFHADGTLAVAPIALVEVQAYAFAAWRGAAELAAQLGQPDDAAALERRAARMRQQFEDAYWLDDLGTYALALDAQKQPCRVRTSNAGHALFAGIVAPDRAKTVAEGFLAPAFFSAWGIRTVAEGEARYNPMSYHNGSVWPHDNGLIAMGLARYGLKHEMQRVLTGLFDAALFMDLKRLPELFCGFARRPGIGPTRYPVACLPQAWSSATVFAMLGATLGVSFDPPARRIRFERPMLPTWLDTLHIRNLRLNDASVDLALERRGDDLAMHVLRRDGDVDVTLTL